MSAAGRDAQAGGSSDQTPYQANVVAIGCLMAVAGFFSGGMIAVLVGRFYSWASHCPFNAQLPACNWQVFAGVGGLIGFVTLPALVLLRLRRPTDGRPLGRTEQASKQDGG